MIVRKSFQHFCRQRDMDPGLISARLQSHFMDRMLDAEHWGYVLGTVNVKQEARRIFNLSAFKGKKDSAPAAPAANGSVATAPPQAPPPMGNLLGGGAPAALPPGGILGAAQGPAVGQILQGSTEQEVVQQMESVLAKAVGPTGGDSAVGVAKLQEALASFQKSVEAKIEALSQNQQRVETEVKAGQVAIVQKLHNAAAELSASIDRAVGSLQEQQNLSPQPAAPTYPPQAYAPAAPVAYQPPAPAPVAPRVPWLHSQANADIVAEAARNLAGAVPTLPPEYRTVAALAAGIAADSQQRGILDATAFIIYFGIADQNTGIVQQPSAAFLESRVVGLQGALAPAPPAVPWRQ